MIRYWAWEKDGKQTTHYKLYTEDEYWDREIIRWLGAERHTAYRHPDKRITYDYIIPAVLLEKIPVEELVHMRKWGIRG